MTRNYNIDAVKFVAAFFVVAIHTTGYLYYNNTATFKNYYSYRGLLDLAVPLFFALSGYLIANKNTEKLKAYTKKIALLFVFSTILFIILRLIMNTVTAAAGHTGIIASLQPILQGFTADNLINGTIGYAHLWYLSASMFACMILIFFLSKKYTPTKILVLSAILYVISLSSIVSIAPLTYAGGVPLALVCTAIGIYVAKKTKNHIYRPKQNLTNLLYFMILMLSYMVARWLMAPIMFNLLLPAAVYFLLLVLSQPGRKNPVSKLGQYALWVYILHPIFIEILYKIIYPSMKQVSYIYSLRVAIISIIVVTFFSILLAIPMEKVWTRLQHKYL